ncbi:MAG: hypothetical protein HC893_05085, partial [Chloroflexaceae bacterium]|nr:hypothetical protein [Chloroflexaceae bacterium]
VYLRARWYHPQSGTFTSRDPFGGFAEQPYSLHPYQYAYGNPLRWTDPSGECIPKDVPLIGEPDCEFIGWDRVQKLDLNWEDGLAYYDGWPGTIGKLSLIALFPPSAYVFSVENLGRGYIRYAQEPNLCNGTLVFVDGALLLFPMASSTLGGGGGMATSGGVAVLANTEIQAIYQQLIRLGIGMRLVEEYVFRAVDMTGESGGGSGSGGGPYSNLEDPSGVGPGKDFTPAQKRKIIQENRVRNGGVVRSDLSGEELVKPQKSQKGTSPPDNEWQIDHITPKDQGGSNSYKNAQVLSRKENRAKWNR